MLLNILFFTFLASIVSLALVSILLTREDLMRKISFSLVSFAAGALLATGFLDTFKEAVALAGNSVFIWVTLAFAGFFIIERLFIFVHHHHGEGHPGEEEDEMRLPTMFLLFGDGMHNFIDGISIATSFLVSFPLGLITTTAVFVHEIPHELGDFGILIHKGYGRKQVLLFNFLTGVTAIGGAILAFYVGNVFIHIIPIFLAITTANFIYLSATDLLPEIHTKAKKNLAMNETIFFVLGILLIWGLIQILG
jgi:zinc and cadmium transporter